MVRKVQILGENFERFANDKPLFATTSCLGRTD